MKFDYLAFKDVCLIVLGVSLALLIICVPGCFNTPGRGHLNMSYMIIAACLLCAAGVILVEKYL